MENKKQTFKEVFSDMKDLFKDIFQDEIKDLKFADYKAADGTIIRTDSEEIQVGSKLQVITPDGVMDVPVEVTEMVIMVNEMPIKVYVENGVVKGLEPEVMEEEPVMEEMNSNQEFIKRKNIKVRSCFRNFKYSIISCKCSNRSTKRFKQKVICFS